MGEDERGRAGECSPSALPCGGRQGCPAAGARGFWRANAVPLLPVSQSEGPFLLLLARKKHFI